MEVIMKTNESKTDRIIRILLGSILGSLILLKVVTGTIAVIVGIVSILMLFTGFLGFCAIYALFGISTCKVKNKQ